MNIEIESLGIINYIPIFPLIGKYDLNPKARKVSLYLITESDDEFTKKYIELVEIANHQLIERIEFYKDTLIIQRETKNRIEEALIQNPEDWRNISLHLALNLNSIVERLILFYRNNDILVLSNMENFAWIVSLDYLESLNRKSGYSN
ncbi:MAG: hypothetical protein QXE31_00340 [Candidatus Woesearchaeota archaeon]